MIIKHAASAGTLESSDAYITVEPLEGELTLDISSSVMSQFGLQIRDAISEVLQQLDVSAGRVTVVDHGALDCTLRARTACAVFRSADVTENYPWEDLK